MKNQLLTTGILAAMFAASPVNSAKALQLENLDRGVLAIKTSSGVFVNWRFLGTDTKTTSFNIYRDGTKINDEPLTKVTNYTDSEGSTSSRYVIKTVIEGVETETSAEAEVWENSYKKLHLQRPASGVTPAYTVTNNSKEESYPDGQAYSYTPNDCSVGDVDGDGEYEILVKWDPSNSRDNSLYGYTGNVYIDCYKLDGTFLWRIDLGRNIRAGAHYTQFMVYDFDGDGKAEMACRTAPGTLDGKGNAVLMGSDKVTDDYRNSKGVILSGPEYLTMFDGLTGEQITSVAYTPTRDKITGDSYGNRANRFLAAVAYLDGVKPSLVMCRGYYTQSYLVAYDFDGTQLKQQWISASATSGKGAYGEGAHSLAVGDVDEDGCDEIIYGATVVDNDGSILYRTGFGHGDALHFGDLDPDIDGLEVYMVHEEKTSAYGFELHAAQSGEVLYGEKTGSDIGRGLAADIDINNRGYESWSTASKNVYNCKGDVISTKRPSVNFRIYWDGDLLDEILDGNVLDKWENNSIKTLVNFNNYEKASTCNSTKNTPNLSADILGDWREEVVLWDGNTSSDLLIFATTIPTSYRIPTLMHDHIYRLSVAWQNVAYNQPPHLGYYLRDNDAQTARLKKLSGSGSLSQSLELGYAIESISYQWINAEGVSIQGLPEGVSAAMDQENQTFTISGTPSKEGTYNFTITTTGSENTVTLDGTLIVKQIILTPVAHYQFDESAGTTAANSIFGSASASDYTPVWNAGVFNNSVHFAGTPTTACLKQAHYDAFNIGQQDFTIEMWFRSAGQSGCDWYLLHKGSHKADTSTGATGKWIGIQYKNDNLTFGIDDNVTKSNLDVAAASYFNNEWVYLVCVRDTDTKMLKMYINGELVGEKSDATGDIFEQENIVIGNCNVNFNTPFAGDIDDVKISTGAMSAGRIKEKFNSTDVPSAVAATRAQKQSIRLLTTQLKDNVRIRFNLGQAQQASVQLSSVAGGCVYSQTFCVDPEQDLIINDLENLAPGIYVLNVKCGNAVESFKLIR